MASDELSLREPAPDVREPRPTSGASRLTEPVSCTAVAGVDARASHEAGMPSRIAMRSGAGVATPLRQARMRSQAKLRSTHVLATLPESQTPESTRGWREDPRVVRPRLPALHANGSHKDTSGLPPSVRENRVAALPDRCRVHTKIRGIRSLSARRPYAARNRLDRCGSNHPDKNQLADCGSSSAALHQERLLAPENIARGVRRR